MSKLYCPKCGAELWQTAEVCPICEAILPAQRKDIWGYPRKAISAREIIASIPFILLWLAWIMYRKLIRRGLVDLFRNNPQKNNR